MATAYTRAQMRDEVRRLMEIVPPIDAGTGAMGDEPLAQSDPQNTTINTAINQGISAINRVVRVGPIAPVAAVVPAAPAGRLGKQYIDIAGQISNALSPNEIEDVLYTEGANTWRLIPYQYYKSAKNFDPFQQYPAGKPQMFVVAGTQIALIPPSLNGGNLSFDAASSIALFAADTDSTSLLPDDYQWAIIYWAVSILSARKASDMVAAGRAAKFGDMAREATLQIYTWKNGFDEAGVRSVQNTLSMMNVSDIMRQLQAQQAQAQPQGQGQGQ